MQRVGKDASHDGRNSWVSVTVPGGGSANLTIRMVGGCTTADLNKVYTTTRRIIRDTGKGSPGRPLTLLASAFIMIAGGDLADAVGERGTGMYVAWEGVSNPLRPTAIGYVL